MTQSTEETVVATTQVETPRKHCWECLRRRLVCDSVQPVCNRCRTSGLVCPGYEEKQPLRWVKPGRVTARARRRPKVGVRADKNKNKNKKSQDDAEVDADVTQANIEDRNPSTSSDCSDDELQVMFSALSVLGIMQPGTLDAIMRYDISCENFAGVQASYICKLTLLTKPFPFFEVSLQDCMMRA
ncbi:hypothetical protein E0Z10_g5818 [Xylaria hypoxylon]|uniref:Zn(2)-C6 fungal-type domain-containing protein n=1 Tax=Xylaria hypoxylon TaxID=37992 RepID=A0A4Z0YF48_9PEZI|nr:hypothetical protein E0Z10_g5818 [Xylaria hypoxylon]